MPALAARHKAMEAYYRDLAQLHTLGADYEQATRTAFAALFSAFEWVVDQYQASTDARSGITSDPNRRDDPQYIVRLVKQVVTVSVETVRLVRELTASVDLLTAVGVAAGVAAGGASGQ